MGNSGFSVMKQININNNVHVRVRVCSCVRSDLCEHVAETVAAFQAGRGGGQQNLCSDLAAVHFVCVGLGVLYKRARLEVWIWSL